VAFGCVLDAWEVAIDLINWRRARRNPKLEPLFENPGSWRYPLAALGLFLVVRGIVSETVFEVLNSNVESQLRSYESDKITAAESKAADAIRDAGSAKQSAEGTPLGTVQALLGHASPETTREIYIESLTENARALLLRAAEKLIGPKWTRVPECRK